MKLGIVADREQAEMFATLARVAGNDVVAWAGGPTTDGLDRLDRVTGLDLVLLGVSAASTRATIRALGLGPADRVVLTTHGLEPDTGRRLSTLVEAESACLRVGVLAGPVFPSEVRRRSPCAVTCASRFDEVANVASALLHSPVCRVYPSADLAGVELAGALVEVLAAALGAARGLGLGVGTQALVVSRGIAEGARLGATVGGDPRTFAGLAGAGELIASMAIPDHPGVARGLALARGEPDPELAALCATLMSLARDLPITAGVARVARGEVKAADALSGLLARDVREELDA